MLQGFHTLVLFCNDTASAKEWYERLGFTPLHGHEGMHWFKLGESQIMLHPGDFNPGAGSTQSYAAVSDVDAYCKRVTELGFKPVDVHTEDPHAAIAAPVTRPWGAREFNLIDPEGHVWAFTQATGFTQAGR